ncbi:glycine receptor subunit alpha-2-like [Uloborus diversus]|uniref:glycine receptor subunit alpha-2-like n=1 Tax=Uloborus diversus TaxID=327109 RepID=UPI002409C410|nr:glycine receptor subunit alpha-2-like [Uloborus diversus]
MREIEPLQFYLLQPETFELTEDYAIGNFTSLIASFTLVRRLTGSIVNTFAPSTVIVAMSWISFWLHVDAVPARVALGVTSLLTLCTQAQQYKTELPPVNYIIAMDIWLFICIIMVFSTLLEFAVAYNLLRRKCKECREKLLIKKSEKPMSNTRNHTDFKKINSWIKGEDNQIKFVNIRKNSFFREETNNECTKCASFQQSAHRVDKLCRRLFPGFFLTFAIVYWIYYMRIHRNQMLYL